MEYCASAASAASAASMLAEEIWQTAEGFVEVPTYLQTQLKKCGGNVLNCLHFGLSQFKVRIILLNLRKAPFDIFHNVVIPT